MTTHLAQLNIARSIAPKGDPLMAEFYADLDRINRLADAAPGFIWRLVDDSGVDATSLHPFGPDVQVNLSVWTSLQALRDFTFRSGHLDVLRRRREWFVPFSAPYAVNWWLPAGHLPTLDEAGERLELLRLKGSTADAFSFREPFPAP